MKSLSSIGRILYALPFIVFGMLHFMYGSGMAAAVPKFVPGGVFWVYFTGLALIAAGVSIILNRYARLASVLLAVLLLIFVVTVHLPGLMNQQTMQMAMTGLLKDLALAGSALVVSSVAKN